MIILLYLTGGGGAEAPAPTPPVPFAKIYIASFTNDRVVKANLDGTGGENFGDLGLVDAPAGFALDEGAGKLYVASCINDRIVRANLDGTGAENLGNPGGFLDGPLGIVFGTQ